MPEHTLGFLLHDATRLIRRRFEARAHELGLTTAQWRLLVQLKREGPLAQARLAELLEIEPISVSRLVDRMEEANWVLRKQDSHDRRVKLVHPSPKAISVFEQARCIADATYEKALRGVSKHSAERLTRTLHQVIDNLSDDEARIEGREEKDE